MDVTRKIEQYTSKLSFLDTFRDFIDSAFPEKQSIGKLIAFLRRNLLHVWVVGLLFNIKPITYFMAIFTVLLTRSRQDAHPVPLKSFFYFVKNAFYMIIFLLSENCFVYTISYFDENKYRYISLQDNLQRILRFLMPWWGYLLDRIRLVVTIPEADKAFTILMFCLVLQLFRRWKFSRVNVFVWAGLYCKTTLILRIIRTIGFLSVVMPSPRKYCYEERYFEPHGLIQFASEMIKFRFGGCNDLLFSGHTLFFWTSVMALQEADLNGFTPRFLKIVVPPALMNMAIERHHYSIDILMGVSAAYAVWKLVVLRELKKIQHFQKLERNLQKDLEDSESIILK